MTSTGNSVGMSEANEPNTALTQTQGDDHE